MGDQDAEAGTALTVLVFEILQVRGPLAPVYCVLVCAGSRRVVCEGHVGRDGLLAVRCL